MGTSPFHQHVVILTGASRGIGQQLAYQLAAQGAWLVLAARGLEPLEAVAAECRQRGARALAVQTDLREEAQCQRLIDQALATYGRIDLLIHDAAYSSPRSFERLPDLKTVRAEIETNYLGVAHCTYYALPHLKQSKGRIVGLCSAGGLIGLPGTIGYNASKHAMSGFLNTLRTELPGSGVSVTVIYLAAILTESLKQVMGEHVKKIPTMLPERAAAIALKYAAKRKLRFIPAQVRFLLWMQLFAPALVDRLVSRYTKTAYIE